MTAYELAKLIMQDATTVRNYPGASESMTHRQAMTVALGISMGLNYAQAAKMYHTVQNKFYTKSVLDKKV